MHPPFCWGIIGLLLSAMGISGSSSAEEPRPSKAAVVGSNPISRSTPFYGQAIELRNPMPSKRGRSTATAQTSPTDARAPMTAREVYRLLEEQQGVAVWSPRFDAISELIFTILSQHTSDVNSMKAFHTLQDTMGPWERVAQSDPEEIAGAIRNGGLSRVKAPRIKAVLQAIQAERGDLELTFLKHLPLGESKAWLQRLPGVGPKTAAIVLCFALGMPAMPVDTHIFRVSRRTGLIPPGATPEQAHDLLEPTVAPERVFAFHMYLISHGRRVCKARRPLCVECVLASECPSAFQA